MPVAGQGSETDTIAAIATAPGRGGIGIIRLSGAAALPIALQICRKRDLKPRFAHYSVFYSEEQSLDDGLVLYFPGPQSFTGEDIIELQGHGGPVVLNTILFECLARGARLARAGEFSERAFLNDKLDLVQAEAIADLINAQTQTAARQARASLKGTFSDAINAISKDLIALRVYVEAAIDFPDEEIDFLSEGKVAGKLADILDRTHKLRQKAHEGAVIRDGVTVVLAGRPNAGKSSLLNVLSGDHVAIVTDQPGTTRDIIRQPIELDGIPIFLSDTAGLREASDQIEQEGIKRAFAELENADLTLHIIDELDAETSKLSSSEGSIIRVLNKTDLTGRKPGAVPEDPDAVALSTITGEGLDTLKDLIVEKLGVSGPDSTRFSARSRHVACLDKTLALLEFTEQQFSASGAGELLAEDLRAAHNCLGEITGQLTSDALLGEIFSNFCIGK